MSKSPIQSKISALYLCAEILIYPTQSILEKLKELKELTDDETGMFGDLTEIETEYIQLFSVGATSNQCVPLASWWLDGKMMGKSFSEIKDFYHQCGFVVDREIVKEPDDHIGLMLLFVALLCEEEKYAEVDFFITNYLQWLNKLELSIEKALPKSIFLKVVSISINILYSLKEK